MARLFRQRTTHYIDSNCKRCKASDPSATKVTKESKKWYGEYRDADDILKRVPLSTNKTASQAMLADLMKAADRRRSGFGTSHDDALATPLVVHVDAYKAVLESRNLSPVHIGNSIRSVKKVLTGCRFTFWRDVQPSRIEVWLQGQQADGRGLSTLNHTLESVKAFFNWMIQDGRAPSNPVAVLRRFNADTDRRRVRRSLTDKELKILLTKTGKSGKVRCGFDGESRSMLYLTAAFTGLRASELASLTVGSFDFQEQTFTVQAAHAKNRRQDTLPLHPILAEKLRAWLADRSVATLSIDNNAPLWPGNWAELRKGASMLRADLADAGIESETEDGRRIDFHALRTTFVTQLARAGVTLVTAQRLARHSTPTLTAKNYTRLELHDLAGSVAMLPSPSAPPEVLAATGTDDAEATIPSGEQPDLFTAPFTVQADKKGGQERILDETVEPALLAKETRKPLQNRGFPECPRQESNLHGCYPTRPST